MRRSIIKHLLQTINFKTLFGVSANDQNVTTYHAVGLHSCIDSMNEVCIRFETFSQLHCAKRSKKSTIVVNNATTSHMAMLYLNKLDPHRYAGILLHLNNDATPCGPNS